MLRKVLSLALVFTVGLSVANAEDSSWVGKAFPEFKVANQAGETITNSKYQGKWVAYYFYPKDNTPGCSIEAEQFAKKHAEFQKMGLEVVGISLDDVESHQEFANDFNVKFDLLADVDKSLSEKLDMVNILPWPHTRRETFLVNDAGVIVKHYATVNPRKHVAEIENDFKALSKK